MNWENGTNPNDADSDDDRLTDSEEVELGTDPNDSDSDDDGISDGREIEDGTDPLKAEATEEDKASCSTATTPSGLWPMLLMMLPFYRRRK